MAASIALLDHTPVGNLNLPALKICGFIDPQNLRAVAAIDGVDAVGLNFYPKSKRAITKEIAQAWQDEQNIREFGVIVIGVFVNPSLHEVEELFARGLIDVAQLHGTESPEVVAHLMEQGIPVIKAHGLKSAEDLGSIDAFATPYHLIDAFAPGVWGGTGETVDWSLLADWSMSGPASRRLVLSGGITPENARQAAVQVKPSMLDVASGVETSPGIKDVNIVKTLVKSLTYS